jgi:hypothetical protein
MFWPSLVKMEWRNSFTLGSTASRGDRLMKALVPRASGYFRDMRFSFVA